MYPPVSQHQILGRGRSAHRSKGCVARGRAQDSGEDRSVAWKKGAGESSVQKRLVGTGSRNPSGNHWIALVKGIQKNASTKLCGLVVRSESLEAAKPELSVHYYRI
jgi:hypothetical protein